MCPVDRAPWLRWRVIADAINISGFRHEASSPQAGHLVRPHGPDLQGVQ